MSGSTLYDVPPGWYPDPAGSRQWRVWTGTKWSEVTRPYGETAGAPRLATLALVRTLRRVMTLGVVGVLAGTSLLVGVLAHWPGTAAPAPTWYSLVASNLALALLGVGSVVCAFGVKELRGHWTIDAFLPGVNLFVVGLLVARRLGRVSTSRITLELVLTAVFVTSFHADPWLGLAPVVVAFAQVVWLSALIDTLAGPASHDGASTP